MNNLFACPTCRVELVVNETTATCERCSFSLKNNQGVWVDARVAGERDKEYYDHIYDGAHGERWYQGLNRKSVAKRLLEYISLSYRRERFFKRHLQGTNNRILDIACGAGRDYFAAYGDVVGVDLSFEPLLKAKDAYKVTLQSGVASLPFPDNYFDYVISSDFFGHVAYEDKDAIMQEMKRVLKPDGKTIHIIENDSSNVWFRIAKQRPDLYKKYFIEQIGGHIGLELPTDCMKRWEKNGFEPTVVKKIWGTIWPVQSYTDLFDNEYVGISRLVRSVVVVARAVSRFKLVQVAVNIILNPINSLVESLTDLNHGQGLMIVCRKKK